tara:strand:+ start:165 stop:1244 length:1080 start_codon:yes stop_codon:yes gene_type:complete
MVVKILSWIFIGIVVLVLVVGMVTISLQSAFVEDSIKITHTPYFNKHTLGDLEVSSSSIEFKCKEEIATLIPEKRTFRSGGKDVTQTVLVPNWVGIIKSGKPRNECWISTLTLDDGDSIDKFLYENEQKFKLNKYMNATFDGDNSFITFDIELKRFLDRDSGKTTREWITYYGVFKQPRDEVRWWIFEIDNSFLTMEWQPESLLRLTTNDKPILTISNDLVNNVEGELLVKLQKHLTGEEKVISIPLTIKKGRNDYLIDMPKSTLGGLTTETELSFNMFGRKIYIDEKLEKTFNIIPNIDLKEVEQKEIDNLIGKSQDGIESDKYKVVGGINKLLLVLMAITLALVIGMVIILIFSKRK